MAQQLINIGTTPNDGTGDPLRTAFDKVNSNDTEVYVAGPVGSNIQIAGNTISSLVDDIILQPDTVSAGKIVLQDTTDINGLTTINADLKISGSFLTSNSIQIVDNIVTPTVTTLDINNSGDITTTGTLTVNGESTFNADISVIAGDIRAYKDLNGNQGNIAAGGSINVGLNQNSNSAIAFNFDIGTSTPGGQNIFFDNAEAVAVDGFKLDITSAEEEYIIWHDGNREAPIDGTPYARQDASWVPASAGGGGMTSWTVSDGTNTLAITDGNTLTVTSTDANIVPIVGTELDLKLSDDVVINESLLIDTAPGPAIGLTVVGDTQLTSCTISQDLQVNGISTFTIARADDPIVNTDLVTLQYLNANRIIEEVVTMTDQNGGGTADADWTGTMTDSTASNVRLQFLTTDSTGALSQGTLTMPDILVDTPQIVNITLAFDDEDFVGGATTKTAVDLELINGGGFPVVHMNGAVGGFFTGLETGSHIVCESSSIIDNISGYPVIIWVCYVAKTVTW